MSIILTLILLAIIALIVTETGGLAAPVIPQIMAALGLTALTFPATAGEFCNPIADRIHLGGNTIHNECADIHPPNEFSGFDVFVSDGVDQKYFDAISHGKTVLWEAKTYIFNKVSEFILPPDTGTVTDL